MTDLFAQFKEQQLANKTSLEDMQKQLEEQYPPRINYSWRNQRANKTTRKKLTGTLALRAAIRCCAASSHPVPPSWQTIFHRSAILKLNFALV